MTKPALSEEIYLDQRMIQLKDLLSVETIKTDNGTAIKFLDGTLICRGKTTIPSLNGGGTLMDVPFPVNFIDNTYDVTLGLFNGGAYWSWLVPQVQSKSTNKLTIQVWSNTTYTSESTEISYIAIGRWK